MDGSTLIWVVVAVVAVLVLIGVGNWAIGTMSKRREEKHRHQAAELRKDADAVDAAIQRHRADAEETESLARETRAEADRMKAAAEQLEAEAREQAASVDEEVQHHREVLQEADRLDPDVEVGHRRRAEST